MQETVISKSVRRWLESFVIDLNLCPFAKRELVKNRIRFKVTNATTEEELLTVLQAEVDILTADEAIETTLLIHPQVLQDFGEYNQFLQLSDALLQQLNLEGVYQIASFHPDYQFANTQLEDVENYTNRSPYPMLHVLREKSLERVIADFPDTDEIPVRNMALMRRLGRKEILNMAFVDSGD